MSINVSAKFTCDALGCKEFVDRPNEKNTVYGWKQFQIRQLQPVERPEPNCVAPMVDLCPKHAEEFLKLFGKYRWEGKGGSV